MNKQEFEDLVSRALAGSLYLGYAGYMDQYNAIVDLFDKARTPVADAAWFLYSAQPALQNWLIVSHPEKIKLSAKVNGEAALKEGVAISVGRLCSFVVGLGEFELDPRFPIFYPDRQATADAAEFLVTKVGVGQYWLKNVGAQHIRADAKEFEAMLKAREVNVKVTVNRLVEGDSGGYVDLKFFKGDVKVGDVRISGKTGYPYERTIALSGDYDQVRCESSPSALYSFERVKK